ncbi:LLM class flavin-dependent oxidoreductase [Allorhizobium taibaishanense]|uniref:Oxidoreductase n=1 Tax=Allorhizobium taibaishanense TaxID=887144 RepID=A0A1Q9A9Z4_9HYPH|nr:LLM class flavin-dependent oxidoreductase [Allorhizobium taibaishanense]MBB4010036.1 alkanesulfonate monooxygenase SsuD/methylene tetrahydromethanopterin reductase-like flavin-dependent oxidoreductase (luciferase family) [Allorhizobium taibaishanense]OLP51646.1 oxidoreductase [Allorhizobium taibaishanense]
MPFAHLRNIAFLVPGNYRDDDPFSGLEETLRLIELGERLGYHSAWVRQRHLERGISSAATFLAAATQRTRHIELGTAVIQLGYENPFRLAEDLATVDVLSRGRLNVGVSAGPPPFSKLLGDLIDPVEELDFSYARAERLARALSSAPLANEAIAGNAAGSQVPRLRPFASGLTQRLWYGGGSLASATWAGRAGFHLLTGNIITGEGTDDFLTAQQRLIDRFLENWTQETLPRIGLGRVILPTDGADAVTRRRYADFVERRTARTLAPNGPKQTLFLPDIIGSIEEIAEILSQDPVLPRVSELRLELPYEFEVEDYQQILTDFASALQLGQDAQKAR